MAHIRSASRADAGELTRLRWEFRIESGTPASRPRAAFDEEMRGFLADVFADASPWRVWVAESDRGLVGCVWLQLVEKVPHPNRGRWERPVAYVTNMYVAPELRDRGVGRELLDRAIAYATEREVDGIVLWPSPRSAPFYARAGFDSEGAGVWLDITGD